MDKLSAYEYFKVIARTKSISAAADELGISQPALSAFLKRQEVSVGVPLVDRSSTPMSLTEAGKTYLNYLEKADMLMRKTEQEICDIENLKKGHLVIGGAVFFNVSYLPYAVAEFSQIYPGIDVEIVDGKVSEITSMALAGSIDVFTTPAKDDESQFEYEKMFDEKIFLCVPPNWEVNNKLPKASSCGYAELSDRDFDLLKDLPFITLHSGQDIGRKMDALFKKHNFIPSHTIMGGQTLTTLGLTLSGAGISLISESTLKNYKMSERPCIYLIDPEICSRSMYIAYPKNQYVSRATKEFIKILLKHNK